MAARGTSHSNGVPGGGLKVDVGGGVGNFRGGTTHDTGEGLHTRIVANHHIFGVELTLNIIKRGHLFTLSGAAHHQIASNAVHIKRVHRLAQQQHQVVGHVGGGVDGALTAQHQLTLQPPGGFHSWVNAGHLTQTETKSLRLWSQLNR